MDNALQLYRDGVDYPARMLTACCSLEEARAMFDEMWEAETARGLLGWFEDGGR